MNRPPPDSTLFPYTTLFRSAARADLGAVGVAMHQDMSDRYIIAHKGTRVRKCHTSRRDMSWCIATPTRSEEHTSELQSRLHLVCRLLLEKKKNILNNEQTLH